MITRLSSVKFRCPQRARCSCRGSSNARDEADDCESRMFVECVEVVPVVDTEDVLC